MSETILPTTNPIRQPKIPVDNRQSDGKFGPGNNANPYGRPPKDWTMKSLLLEVAEEEVVLKNKLGQITGRKLFKELIARKLWQKAASGDMQAIKEILDRIDGKATQHIDHTSGGEKLTTPMHMLPEEKDE